MERLPLRPYFHSPQPQPQLTSLPPDDVYSVELFLDEPVVPIDIW